MAYTTINKSSDYFNTKLYTGTGAENAISDIGFNPDWVWFKKRSASEHHFVYDQVRGALKKIAPSNTNAEGTETQTLKSFDTGGYTLGTSAEVNGSSTTYVAWNWKANGQGSANTDGSINTTYTSANTTSGFSISKYTGTGSNATVGHGLGVAPRVVMVKDLSSSGAWRMYTAATGNQSQLALDQTSAADSGNTTMWNSTSPTSTVFSIGTHGNVNTSGNNYIAYCFADVQGFSKVGGSYTGNGSATDGAFVYTGFKPAFVLLKGKGNTSGWCLIDNKRNPENAVNKKLFANLTNAEATADVCDFLSNGFKLRTTDSSQNDSGQGYIYMAFAEAPLVGSNNVPCTAR